VRALIVAGVAALAVVPALSDASAPKPVRKTVKVGDDYFAPLTVKVPVGSTIVWKWLVNSNTHDVKLKKGPKGVKKFQSDPATTDYSYKRKLKVKGKYVVICTFHQDMKMTVTVR
jgi:plastocyanin